jgi:hypothetical protein
MMAIQADSLCDGNIIDRILKVVDKEPYRSVGLDSFSLAREINVSFVGML